MIKTRTTVPSTVAATEYFQQEVPSNAQTKGCIPLSLAAAPALFEGLSINKGLSGMMSRDYYF